MSENEIEAYFRFFNEVGIINQLITNRVERVLPHGLTISQFTVLNHFVRGLGPRSPIELASAFQVTKGAMTNTLKQLNAKGFIEIRPHESDGRSKLVDISPAGRKAHEAARGKMRDATIAFTQEFSASEMAEMLPTLERVRIWLDENRT